MLEYATEVFNPQSAKLVRTIEKPQRFFTKVALRKCGYRSLPYRARIKKFGVDTLELRRAKQDIVTFFKPLGGAYDIPLDKFLPIPST